MKNQITTIALSGLTICGLFATQTTYAASNANEHAPIGVMGDHNHNQGEWMIAYRYNRMNMKNKLLDSGDILGDAMMAPSKMKKEMHMFGMMYGLTDTLTVVANIPYTKVTMDQVTRMGPDFTLQSKGVGDVKIAGLYTLYEKERSKLIFNAGLSLPTGSINAADDTPAGSDQRLPYTMQLGSGTYDVLSKLTYTYGEDNWAWGSQLNAIFRTGENDNGYRLGNQYGFSIWASRNVTDYASISFCIDGTKSDDVNVANLLNMAPMARNNLNGGERVDLLVGANFIVPNGPLEGNRFAFEFGKPIHQERPGSPLEADYRLTVGWQLAF